MNTSTQDYVEWNQYAPLPQQEFTRTSLLHYPKKQQTCCQRCDHTTVILCGISISILFIVIIVVVYDHFTTK